jgi:hypothetical protein
MPLLGTCGVASSRGVGLLSVANIGGPYWIGRLVDAAYGPIAVDLSGNVYLAITKTGSTIPVTVVKYNSFGVLQWQKEWSDAVFSHQVKYIGVDNSNNIYVVATIPSPVEALIIKLDSNGNILYNKRVDITSGNLDARSGYLNPTTSELYVIGVDSATKSTFVKYNSSLVGQFTRTLSDVNVQFNAITIDGSGNIFVGGFNNGSFNVCKYDSSANLLWQKEIYSSGNVLNVYGLATDSSGNVYATGYFYNGSIYVGFTIKIDSSGSLQWQTRLLGMTDGINHSVAVDSNNSVYTCGYSDSNNAQLAKYDSSGNLQWQRSITTPSQVYAISIKIDRSNNLYVGMTNNYFAKLPSDGSLTGTYSVGGASVTYQTSTLTSNSTGLSFRSSTITSATGSDITNNLSGTITSGTLTSSVTTL